MFADIWTQLTGSPLTAAAKKNQPSAAASRGRQAAGPSLQQAARSLPKTQLPHSPVGATPQSVSAISPSASAIQHSLGTTQSQPGTMQKLSVERLFQTSQQQQAHGDDFSELMQDLQINSSQQHQEAGLELQQQQQQQHGSVEDTQDQVSRLPYTQSQEKKTQTAFPGLSSPPQSHFSQVLIIR